MVTTTDTTGHDLAVVRPERYCFGAATPPPGAVRVLVVDERPHLAALSAAMLADLGHCACWCIDTRDLADRLASGEPIDLLVLPLSSQAAVGDGIGIALAAQRQRPGLRVLLTAGSTRPPLTPQPFEVLLKPYGRAKLARMLNRVLG